MEERHDDRGPSGFGGTMYIFLHGLMGSSIQDDHVDILIPEVGDKHTYRYGEFLGEVTLPASPTPYHIRGIYGKDQLDPQDPPFSSEEHLVTNKRLPICGQPKLHATITVPIPDACHSVLQIDFTDLIEDPAYALKRTQSNRLIGSMIPILEYHFHDPRSILFGCDPLNVAPMWYEDHWYINLHIFAEEDVEREDEHTIAGFDAVAGIFDFPCAPKLLSLSNVVVTCREDKLPPGTTIAEFSTLAARTREQGIMGRDLREQFLHRNRALVHVSPISTDPTACTHVSS